MRFPGNTEICILIDETYARIAPRLAISGTANTRTVGSDGPTTGVADLLVSLLNVDVVVTVVYAVPREAAGIDRPSKHVRVELEHPRGTWSQQFLSKIIALRLAVDPQVLPTFQPVFGGHAHQVGSYSHHIICHVEHEEKRHK